MTLHSEIAPLNTSFVPSTHFPSPPASGGTEGGKRGGMSPPRRSSLPSPRRSSLPSPRRSLLPPLPPSSQIPTTHQPTGLENFNPGPRTSRQSISQSSPAPAFTFGSLPPMSPAPSSFRDTPSAPVANHYAALPPLPFMRPTALGASSSALPPSKIHRRANSDSVSSIMNPLTPQGGMRPVYPRPVDMPVGVMKSKEIPGEEESDGEDDANAYMDIVDHVLYISKQEDAKRISGDSENGRKATSGVKRRAGKEIAPSSSSRSFPVDSNHNGNSSSIGGELPPSPGNLQGVTNSVDGNNNGSQTETDVELTASEMAKITCSEKPESLDDVSPKKAKRIKANRESAARSKKKQAQHLVQLEGRVKALVTENATLTAHTQLVERARMVLEEANKHLRIRIEGMAEHAKLQNDFIQYLTVEVNRLKKATGEVIPNTSEYGRSNVQSMDVDIPQRINLNQSSFQQPQTNLGL